MNWRTLRFYLHALLLLPVIFSATACASHQALPIPPGHPGLQIHPVFTSNAVLQRESMIPFQGNDVPGQQVWIEFRGQTFKTTTSNDGIWSVPVPAGAAGGPFIVLIRGTNLLSLQNVMVGDVWICSGQSNMEWPLAWSENGDGVSAAANDPQLRLIDLPHRLSTNPEENFENVKWAVCTPETVKNFSGIGYYFGKHLRENLNVPIGLIGTNWGGTRIQPWIPASAAEESEYYRTEIGNYAERRSEWKKANPDNENYPQPMRPQDEPAVLYNGMIAPLVDYPVRGVIWYQGESNAGHLDEALAYRHFMPLLIKTWREKWGIDFPFLFVQLAPFGSQDPNILHTSAVCRESQSIAAQTTPQTGMAVITDYGHCTNIHPPTKKPVGDRLALQARRIAYGEDVKAYSPVYKEIQIENNVAVVHFDHAYDGLTTNDNKAIRGFQIAGKDKDFISASAEIAGNTVRVWHESVEEPVAVRYGWISCPDVNLSNSEGLPASSFRSDNWDLSSLSQ